MFANQMSYEQAAKTMLDCALIDSPEGGECCTPIDRHAELCVTLVEISLYQSDEPFAPRSVYRIGRNIH
jgi:hypothetical protein